MSEQMTAPQPSHEAEAYTRGRQFAAETGMGLVIAFLNEEQKKKLGLALEDLRTFLKNKNAPPVPEEFKKGMEECLKRLEAYTRFGQAEESHD